MPVSKTGQDGKKGHNFFFSRRFKFKGAVHVHVHITCTVCDTSTLYRVHVLQVPGQYSGNLCTAVLYSTAVFS